MIFSNQTASLSLTHTNLLWRDVEGLGPHVNLLVHVNTGQDEEHTGAPGASGQQQPEAEYDSPLVFLTRAQ